jgi:hypothetical protein
MALRFAVQADTEQECAAGLRLLESLGLQTAMLPKLLTDDRWMARAVPGKTKAPPGRSGAGPDGTSAVIPPGRR